MTKKRNRLEVIHDILHVIKERSGKIKPTHVLYKSNLSHSMMEEYLRELIAKKFIEERLTKEGKRYAITEKGLKYLAQYSMITQFTSSFGLD